MSYDFIHKLKPIKECEPDWWELRWKPIKNGTWNIYKAKRYSNSSVMPLSFGVMAWLGGAFNGWGRSWRRFDIKINLVFTEINFWVIWNIKVHKDGPMDVAERKPLEV